MKRNYFLALFLLPVSLIGLLFIQVSWIKQVLHAQEKSFSLSVQQVMHLVAQNLEQQEMNKYVERFIDLKSKDSIGGLKTAQIRDFVFIQENNNTKETFIYKHGLVEKNYVIPSGLLNLPGNDSTHIKDYVSKQISRTIGGKDLLGDKKLTIGKKNETARRFTSFDKAMFEEVFKDVATKLSLNDRISKHQIDILLSQKLLNQGIDLSFEYGIYDYGYLTDLKSSKFKEEKVNYSIFLFENQQDTPRYELVLNFPKLNQYFTESILKLAVLAFIFSAIIVLIFIRTFIELRNQKQISEIKTDFINNMTHEFKTPIATIKLALEAMKNPVVMRDETRLKAYMKMLSDENKRMHSQVENILQISRFDKNQMVLEKEMLNAHELIENAIMHTQLLLDDKGGSVHTDLKAMKSDILASEVHFTNVIVNILENAIKYSPESPKIDVSTQMIHNQLVIKIKDEGQGMNKAVLKKIFQKFYRENTGDLHNVKGHGLGLAYVKRIVKAHNGEIFAESEKGKGSIFTIKVPLFMN